MTKNVSHVSQRIVCPKCGTRNLRKSLHFSNSGEEYFCDKEHLYFSISDLVNLWNYDVADFYTETGTQLTEIEWLKVAVLSYSNVLAEQETVEEYVPYSPDTSEGEWSSETARDESYDVVNRMLMGIEELEDGFDARDLPCPILQVGGC